METPRPRDADTRQAASRDMVEFLNSEPPAERRQSTQTERPFFGKRERPSGGFASRWKAMWGPGRPDPWLPRKGAVL
jgi:hypothetical protein